MKRMHVGMKVGDLEQSIAFYSRLFGAEPTMRRPDYAKWMLDDPRVNFSIFTRGKAPVGTAHYGIQVESPEALGEMRERIDAAGLPREDEDRLVCGYQEQSKSWVTDPLGKEWEVFYTFGIPENAEYYSCSGAQ